MSAETCQATKWTGWETRLCGRPVKADGLCGIHLGVEKRRESSAEARRQEVATRSAASAAIADRLARHGVTARVSYDGAIYLPPPTAIADALDARYPG